MKDLVDIMNQGSRRPVDAAMREYFRQNNQNGDLLGSLQDALDQRQDRELSREGFDYEFEVAGDDPEDSIIELIDLNLKTFNFYLKLDSARW
jgi:hypothetical protein